MIFSISKKILLLSLAWCGFVVSTASAQELKFPQENFAITPPAGWERQPSSPDVLVSYVKPDRSAIVLVIADAAGDPGDVTDETVIAEFEQGLESSGGGKRLWGKTIEVNGVNAYERLGELQIEDRSATGMVRFMTVKGHSYALQGLVFNDQADKNEEILKFMESFRFLTPPTPIEQKSEAYKLGVQLGKYSFYVGLLGLVVGALFLLFWIIRQITVQRRRRIR